MRASKEYKKVAQQDKRVCSAHGWNPHGIRLSAAPCFFGRRHTFGETAQPRGFSSNLRLKSSTTGSLTIIAWSEIATRNLRSFGLQDCISTRRVTSGFRADCLVTFLLQSWCQHPELCRPSIVESGGTARQFGGRFPELTQLLPPLNQPHVGRAHATALDDGRERFEGQQYDQ